MPTVLDGNAAENRRLVTASLNLSATPLLDGQDMAIRWADFNTIPTVGVNDGLAIDDIRIEVTPIPEPAGLLVVAGLTVAAARRMRRAYRGNEAVATDVEDHAT